MIIAIAGLGTWAYYTDTESSTGNVVSAGTMDLQANGVSKVTTPIFTATGKKPGDSATNNTTLKNAGTIPGYLSIATSNATNTNGAGGTEYETTLGETGELGGVAKMVLWIDVNNDGSYNAGTDFNLRPTGGVSYETIWNSANMTDTINNFGGKTWSNIITLGNQGLCGLRTYWTIPTSANNSIQGDNVTMSFFYTLQQVP